MSHKTFFRCWLPSVLVLIGLLASTVSTGVSAAPADLLQFTAQNQILGFRTGKWFVANGSDALRVAFVAANAVPPYSDTSSGAGGVLTPLDRVIYQISWTVLT